MDGLKRCPFCGEEMNEVQLIPFLRIARIYHDDVLKADDNCIAQHITIYNVDTTLEAKVKWNRRAGEQE